MRAKYLRLLLVGCLVGLLAVDQTFARGFGGGGFRGGFGGGGFRGGFGGGGFRPMPVYRGYRPTGMARPTGMPHGGAGAYHGGYPGGAGARAGNVGGTGHSSLASHPQTFNRPSYSSRFGEGAHSGVGNRAAVGDRNFSGNTFNIGNRTVNIAGAGYRPSYSNHGFYHGYWNEHYGIGYGWGNGYWRHPYYWGIGAWGLGALLYDCGYQSYYNPYYGAGGGGSVYDYSQPIPVDAQPENSPAVETPPGETQAAHTDTSGNAAEQQLNPAIDAFKKGDYQGALDLVNQAITKTPTDAVCHEFRGLVLFALQEYQQAAATIHSVLAIGPGWDWTTLTHLYASIQTYSTQLRTLEHFVEEHPQDGAARFLLAYHYLTCGHRDAAAANLKKVVAQVPQDHVAADLLKMIAPPENDQLPPSAEPQSPKPEGSKPTVSPVDPAKLVGTWHASRTDGSKFELELTDAGNFTWKFSQQEKRQDFGGTYSLEGHLLVLERKDGGSLIGELTPDGDSKFHFKMLGSPADDPGLDFSR
ncbi:MAG: tetratricopeptide repeat protein [Planctomycetes bacterium]|nr:tetratricopeptide repeat protein [Planctomycetota bacterium]